MNYFRVPLSFFIPVILLLFFAQIRSDVRCEPPASKKNQDQTATEQMVSNEKEQETSHGDQFSTVYILLFLILAGALGGRFLALKINQPEVLGELIAGVIIGVVLYQFNSPIMTLIRHQDDVTKIIQSSLTEDIEWKTAVKKNLPLETAEQGSYAKELIGIMESPEFSENNMTVQIILLLSNFGVLILLFVIGLESSMEEMFKVGVPALITAVIGVVVPSLLGYFTSMIILPDHGTNFYLFVGATLCATSIGITARVFKDMNKLAIPEAKVVLGAAVIDDILGLIILAVVAGIISSGSFEGSTIVIILLKSFLFLGIVLYAGARFLKQQIKFAALLDNKNIRLVFPFALLFLLAWLSDQVGLASIVGAFAAGLIIKEEYFNDALKDKNITVKSLIAPIETIFAPVFFVIMGLQVDVLAFGNLNILGLALALTFVAILGKLVSGIFAKGMDKKIIGIGMVPRGEVGLIFAGIGKTIGVLDATMFSAIIIIVILTTFITPPALKWAFVNHDKKLSKN
ncbi:MAG: cation:proton antiporter [Ignavibacteria bacterium]